MSRLLSILASGFWLLASAVADPLEFYNPANCVPYSLNNTPSYPATYCRVIPQWYLKNTGEPSIVYQNGLRFPSLDEPGGTNDLHLPAGYRADGIVVGIIDTGCKADHEDLQGVILGGCYISERNNPIITEGQFNDYDPQGHGTGIASIIAANRNGIGMAGVAPGAKLLIVSTALALPETPTQVARGIVWLVDNGADVINLSWGETDVSDASLFAACQYAASQSVIIVSGVRYGGNLDATPSYPYAWNFPNYVAVCATTRIGTLFPPTAIGSRVVGAPGDRIVMASTDNPYVYDNGNSFAAPMVAGLMALRLARHSSSRDPVKLLNRIKASAAVHPVPGIIGHVDAALALQ